MRRDRSLIHIVVRLACVLGVSINGVPAVWLDLGGDLRCLDGGVGAAESCQLAVQRSRRRVSKCY